MYVSAIAVVGLLASAFLVFLIGVNRYFRKLHPTFLFAVYCISLPLVWYFAGYVGHEVSRYLKNLNDFGHAMQGYILGHFFLGGLIVVAFGIMAWRQLVRRDRQTSRSTDPSRDSPDDHHIRPSA